MRWRSRPAGSNWGDFGADDQLGQFNLLTPEARRSGLAEAREGLTFALSLPLDFPGGDALVRSRHPPKLEATVRDTGHVNYNLSMRSVNPCACDVLSDDVVTLWTQYSTQWDSLAHWGQEFDANADGEAEIVYYNGFEGGRDVLGPGQDGPRALKLGIENLAVAGVQGRGVLMDLHAMHGNKAVAVGYSGLMEAMERQRVSIAPGDFLCLYTGWADLLLSMNKQPDVSVLKSSCASLDGTDHRLLQWISDAGIAAICADNLAVESPQGAPIAPASRQRRSIFPLHEHCLFKRGVVLGEMWSFGALAQWLRSRGRSAFLLTAPPLRLPGAVGSPVMPIATV